jgi:hypothetical protein
MRLWCDAERAKWMDGRGVTRAVILGSVPACIDFGDSGFYAALMALAKTSAAAVSADRITWA